MALWETVERWAQNGRDSRQLKSGQKHLNAAISKISAEVFGEDSGESDHSVSSHNNHSKHSDHGGHNGSEVDTKREKLCNQVNEGRKWSMANRGILVRLGDMKTSRE